jgi:serine/threonine protein kinase
MKILKRMRHRHIVQLIGSYTDPKYFSLITSPVADKNLASFLADIPNSRENIPTLRTFFGCLATALRHLHDNHVRHKDIKPQNILVRGIDVLFTDFGISFDYQDASSDTTSGSTAMTPKYCAPEVAACEKRNASSDIWSLGCVFLEMAVVLKGQTLEYQTEFFLTHGSGEKFVRDNRQATQEMIAELRRIGSLPDNQCFTWVESMLQHDRKQRPTAAEIVNTIISQDSNAPYPANPFCGICCKPNDGFNDDLDEVQFGDALDPPASVYGDIELVAYNAEDTDDPIRRIIKLNMQLHPRQAFGGRIYIAQHLDHTRWIKIGHSSRDIQRHLEVQNRSCYKVSLLYGQEEPVLGVNRLEHLVHTELSRFRKRFSCRCGVKHTEWFEITMTQAVESVKRWTEFLQQHPYDDHGYLKPFWDKRLEEMPRLSSLDADLLTTDHSLFTKRWDDFCSPP